ncbi:MAG: ATP-dependent RecD-like DNA helicase [Eubacteriales bacterium]|nr:ATP-dependent RecD-like DNA helicase [Eubacteriales bacterium]
MEEIKGYVTHIVYRNEENFYTVFEVRQEDEDITCTGSPAAIHEGESCIVSGTYTEHPVYGAQFRVSSYQVCPPDDAQAMLRYLSSGAVKGIGASLAARIVKAFGDDTLRVMEEEPERLAEIKGISERGAREIAAQLSERKEVRDAMLYLQQYGIANRYALKIWKQYGMRMYGILQENPYRLAEDIEGIGFATADEIAGRIGIRADSDYRIRSALLFVLSQALAEGNSYLPREEVLARTQRLLSLSDETVPIQLDNLAMERRIYIKRKEQKNGAPELQVYSAAAYHEEQQIARLLVELDHSIPSNREETGKIEERIRRLEEQEGIVLDEKQREAVTLAATHAVLLLSGGPGTGKTTTINTMIRYFLSEQMDVLLAAPTGRAAKRMTETTGYEARTIHRLLGVRTLPGEEERRSFTSFEYGSDNPLEADAVIIDEMSMVDMHLFTALLKAVMPGTRLIMVGDVHQLPCVGPGKVLQDLMESGVFRTIELTKIFRQALESDIVANAHAINEGRPVRLDNQSRDFFFLERNDPQVMYKHIVQLVRDMMPRYANCAQGDVQVLTPMRKGALGVEKLNQALQSVLNPPEPGKKEWQRDETVLRVGDKVMQTRNDYQIEWEVRGNYGIPVDKGTGVFNGDFGVIQDISEAAREMTVLFDENRTVTYPFESLDELELAYAITVHKAQGSEYPAVVLPVLSGPPALLTRNLLYTAVTRAKTCVTILGSRETVLRMIGNVSQNVRCTGLGDRIREIAGVPDLPAALQEPPVRSPVHSAAAGCGGEEDGE